MPQTTARPGLAGMHPGLLGLALLWLLVGCAAMPSAGGRTWAVLTAASAGQQVLDIDFEAVTPQQGAALRQRGVELPRASQRLADPRTHREFIDLRVTAVGFGVTAGGYLLYCEGLPLPVLVPESHVDLALTRAVAWSEAIYLDRDAALAELGAHATGPGDVRYAYYRGAGGALIVPTRFSPATTPRIARTMLEVRQHLSQTVSGELEVLALTLSATRVVQGVFSRVVQVGSEAPALRPPGQNAATRNEVAPPPQPVRGPAAPSPAPPAPVAPAPSPGLVQALAGNNRTPSVAARARLSQDVAVNPKVPGLLTTNRPVGSSPTQNAQVQVDIKYLDEIGAENIRVNQQQITAQDVQRVGLNRPDLQFDYQGRRYHVEYDTPHSGRGPAHQSRATANDPTAETILLIVP